MTNVQSQNSDANRILLIILHNYVNLVVGRAPNDDWQTMLRNKPLMVENPSQTSSASLRFPHEFTVTWLKHMCENQQSISPMADTSDTTGESPTNYYQDQTLVTEATEILFKAWCDVWQAGKSLHFKGLCDTRTKSWSEKYSNCNGQDIISTAAMGSGKTLCILMPLFFNGGKIIIIITSFNLLGEQFISIVKEAGFEAITVTKTGLSLK